MAKTKALSLDDINEGGSSITEAEAGALVEQEVETVVETPPEPVPEPEPVVEPKAEEEIKAEPLKKEPEIQATPLKEEPTPEPEFDLAFFNKTLEKEYESVDQIQAALNKPTMESEYEELKTKYDDLNQTYEVLTEQLETNPTFSDEAIKVEMFKKNNPKKDPAIVHKLFSTADLAEIDDLEVVKMARKFRSKKLPGNEADLEAAILEELGIDPETPRNEWPNTAQIRLASMADGDRDTFDRLKEGIVLPDKVNIEELKAQRKQASDERDALITSTWGTAAEEALKSTEKLKLPIGAPAEGGEQKYFEWDLGSPPQEEVDSIKQEFINLKMDPSEDSRGAFNESLRLSLLDKNLPQILKKLTDDIEARKEEEFLERTHNPKPLTDFQRTEDSGAEKDKKVQTAEITEGLRHGFQGHPLFKMNNNT